MATQPRFEIIPDTPETATATVAGSRESSAAFAAVMLALKALSQRAVVALAALQTLIMVGSAFWLAMSIAPNPNTYQLAGLSIYAVFLLLICWITRG